MFEQMQSHDTLEFLAFVSESVRQLGWEVVESNIENWSPAFELQKLQISEESQIEAEAALLWGKQKLKKSSFLSHRQDKLRVAIDWHEILRQDYKLVATLIRDYRLDRQETLEPRVFSGKFLGEAEEKIQVECTLVSVQTVVKEFGGDRYFCTVKTRDGNTLVWTAVSSPLSDGWEEQKQYVITATVWKHRRVDGVNRTMLLNVELVK